MMVSMQFRHSARLTLFSLALIGWFANAQPAGLNQVVIPKYPSLAKIAHVEGAVTVDLTFDPKGFIQSLKVVENAESTHPFVYAVVSTISKWRLVSHANKSLTVSFIFKLLPHDARDLELDTVVDFPTTIIIKEKKLPPIDNTGCVDPAPLK